VIGNNIGLANDFGFCFLNSFHTSNAAFVFPSSGFVEAKQTP